MCFNNNPKDREHQHVSLDSYIFSRHISNYQIDMLQQITHTKPPQAQPKHKVSVSKCTTPARVQKKTSFELQGA